jgi:hypothetical protein
MRKTGRLDELPLGVPVLSASFCGNLWDKSDASRGNCRCFGGFAFLITSGEGFNAEGISTLSGMLSIAGRSVSNGWGRERLTLCGS